MSDTSKPSTEQGSAMESGEPEAMPFSASFDRQRLQAVLGHIPGFCYTVDPELVFTSSQGAGLSRLELSDNQLVGASLLDLWGTSDPSYEPLRCHRRALEGFPQTYRDVCLGRSLEYRLTPLRDEQGTLCGVLGVGVDVTEREHAKEQELKLTAQLRHAQKMESIGQLAGGVAHDFNNLLTCIMGNLALVERFATADARVSHHLAEANAAAESAAALTRQLLAFSRKQLIDPRPIHVGQLIQRVQGMLRRLIGEGIALRTTSEPELWSVKADPGQIEQILVNLIVNARDAITGDGEISIETHNADLAQLPGTPDGLAAGKYVVVSVRDSGRGISEAVRAKLFEPFFTTKDVGKGTGLGLATVYGSVRQNGGTIHVESSLGQGSTFTIYLPAMEAMIAAEDADNDEAPISGEMPVGTETVLLVEDEPLLLELAQCTLQQLGYDVLACASADEALRTFAEHQSRIDVLFTDVIMPRMNGRVLASRIRSLKPDIAVLYTSGYSENIVSVEGIIDSELNYIAKPYRPSELAIKLRNVLTLRPSRLAQASDSRA